MIYYAIMQNRNANPFIMGYTKMTKPIFFFGDLIMCIAHYTHIHTCHFCVAQNTNYFEMIFCTLVGYITGYIRFFLDFS
jgi:hypothetical protein